ncbi:TPA: F0F1 ATP synthase subunit gamma, partial [Candidatus Uhrbacteria bacterium]|nr:F0F1 ATP synthase subunit gamma [Candidatus Uhrbacteria bacterium]
ELNITDPSHEYLFEPSPSEVLDVMLPRLVESQIYQALLESSASEHSARMLAMRTASDSAEEMIDSLTLSYNQARQAG